MTNRRHELIRRRKALGLSPTSLARLLGVNRTTVHRWEAGESDPRAVQRSPLARALQVTLADLGQLLDPDAVAVSGRSIQEPPVATVEASEGGDENVQRRQFIAGLVATGLASAVPTLQFTSADAVAALDAAVARAVRLEQRSQYAALSALLPGLIGEAERAVADAASIGDSGVARHLAMARTVEAFVLVKQDQAHEAQGAAAAAVSVAQEANNPVLVGTALRCLAETHMRGETYDVAADLAVEGASHIGRHRASDPVAIAVQGAGLLTAATACARAGERQAAHDLLEAAAVCADELGNDHIGSVVFGPTNVAIHRVAIEVELGDPIEALRQAGGFKARPRSGLNERQARYLLDVARAQAETGQSANAVATLLQAESIAPEEIHTHRHSKTVLAGLLAKRGGVSMELRPLAQRCGALAA